MKFQIGDKVKFMDQMGEGVITKIIGPSTVGVTVDGFELPYAAGDLIKIDKPASAAERLFYEGKATYGNPEPKEEDRKKSPTSEPEKKPIPKTLADYGLEDPAPTPSRNTEPSAPAAEDEADIRIQPLHRGFVSKKPQPEGVYIGLLPVDQQFMLRGDIEFHIINFTPYTLLYNLATKGAESFYGVDFASVPPYSRILVESVDREDIGLWTEGILQGLFCTEERQTWLKPFSQTFKIKAQQLSQADNYVLPVFMREKVLLVPMLDAAHHEATHGIPFQERNGKAISEDGAKPAATVQAPHKANPLARYMIAKDTAKVDLHIEKLMETRLECRNIEEREYLSKQLAVFETCLDQAMEQKLSKIIFIHGVGEGTLKHEIEKRLRQYPDVHFMDASITRYGRGAIEVYLKA